MEIARVLREEDMLFFEKNGYWVSPKLFDDTTLENLIRRMDTVYRGEFETGLAPKGGYWKSGDDPRKLRKSSNAHFSDTALYKLCTDVVIGAMAATFLKTNCVRLFNTQLLYKPPRGAESRSGNVGWHQDMQYWQFTSRPTIITAWVAFNDVTVENGCMQMVPGSHTWGYQNEGSFHDQDIEEQEKTIRSKLREFRPVPIEMKAGQVSFHHALTYHGSGRNISDRPRRSMAIHIMSGETRWKAGRAEWENHAYIPAFRKFQDGDMMQGEDFPVLFQNRPVDGLI